MTDPVLVTRTGPIATVTLNRPEKLNALTKVMWRSLGEAIDALAHSDLARKALEKAHADA